MATVEGYRPKNLAEEVVKSERNEGFASYLAGIEMTEYGNPKTVLRYYSVVYGVSLNDLNRTVQCESGFRHEGLFGDGGRAYGIAQFHAPTFKQYCEGEYKDMHDQLWCMAEMFSQHQQHHWTCFSK